jgi:hypothetical protein
MQPIKSNITSTGKCLNPVSTKCVTWDGPDITCLDGTTLCKGQSIETSLYTLATKLCDIYKALSLEDIDTCINGINDGSSISIGPNSSIKEVFSAIIKKVCTLNTRVESLESNPCAEQIALVPECLRTQAALYPNYNSTTYTLPLQYYAELVANVVCGILIDITALNSSVANLDKQISDLWTALSTCSNSTPAKVLPTCTYNFALSPDGGPVTVQTAYSWLEADYCTLKSAIGTADDIANAVNKQCTGLANADRLSSGGTMSGLSGWIDTPTTVADTLTNLWLTVCDMRSAVSYILSTCCKTLCSYLEVGYKLEWDTDGTYVDVSFINPASPTIYTSASVPPYADWIANGTALPVWATTQYPDANQTNVIITVSDGNMTVTLDTGHILNYWTANPTQYRIDFTDPAFSGYDKTSLNQSINIYFEFRSTVGTDVMDCTHDQTDSFSYECFAPSVYPCDVTINSSTGTDMTIKVSSLYDTAVQSLTTGATVNTLEDTTQSWTVNAYTGLKVYIYDGTGQGQCRDILSNTATELTVDTNWDVTPDTTSVYQIMSTVYSYPFAPPSVQSFSVYVVNVTSTFDINSQSTWSIVYASPSPIPLATICTGSGYLIASGLLIANTQYHVVLVANYTCGASVPVYIDTYNPISASVSIQQGTPEEPVSNVFASINTTVDNVLSNGSSLADKTATLTVPAKYALALPTTGTTQMVLTPQLAQWVFNQFTTPKAFCYCGINTDPQAVIPPSNIPARDQVLGQYRGYDVELFLIDSNNNYVPVLDSLSVPYKTDTLNDYALTFSGNTPGSPITLDVPSTYAQSTYPVIVRYNPTPYAVNTGATYHTITFADYLWSIDNNSVNGDVVVKIDIRVKQWDSATSTYVNYSTPKVINLTLTQTVAAGNDYSQTATPGTTLQCAYGDALYVTIEACYSPICGTVPKADFVYAKGSIDITPDPASKFSCNNPTTQTNSTPLTTVDTTTNRLVATAVITEDYFVSLPLIEYKLT